MISFRVSEREFEMLRTLSASEGARSVSDFARLALCGPRFGNGDANGHVHANGNGADPPVALGQLKSEVEALKADIRRLADILEQKAGPRPPLAASGRKNGV